MKLTLPQRDIYFEQLLFPSEPVYNIGAKIKIEGKLDTLAMQVAYEALINQHDAYRTVFSSENEGQTVEATVKSPGTHSLPFVDLSRTKNPKQEAETFMQSEFVKPFDMFSRDYLHKFILIRVNDTFHYLFSVYHHIITDGWGTSLMFQRLVHNYNELIEFGEVRSEYPFSYKTFMENDLAYSQSETYKNDLEYWKDKFSTLPENLFNRIRNQGAANESSRKALRISRKTYNLLQERASETKSTTFHIILATLYLYFGRKEQKADIAIGLPVLNRGKSVFKKTVGLFMSISPLRLHLNFRQSFRSLLKDIKTQLREDYRHQRLPLGSLINSLQAFQDRDRLFNVTLSYEKQDYSLNFANTETTVLPLTHQAERVPLAVYIREFAPESDVTIDFDYNLNYFNEESICQLTIHFHTLIKNVIQHMDQPLKDITYIAPWEEKRLLYVYNDTARGYNQEKTFLHYFKEHARLNPGKRAAFDSTASLSYGELDKLSDRIALHIGYMSNEDSNSSIIGVALRRSLNTLAILLGIMKAGKAYVPLDTSFPADRLNYIIESSELDVLIYDESLDEQVSQSDVAKVSAEDFLQLANGQTGMELDLPNLEQTAYVIYTSGSTGKPKGVEVGHRSLINFLLSMQISPGFNLEDTLFAITTYSFDISILEFFLPLISGGTVYIADMETLFNLECTIKAIHNVNPTIIQATPSFYQLLYNAGWKGNNSLKVLCGGDLLSEQLALKLLDTTKELWNMYGPTETTIWSSIKHITKPDEASIIGKPIANTQFYVLDENLKPLPTGSAGVLYIAGGGLAKGYFKAETITHEKFIPNPFSKNTLMYKTNDLARWTNDGDIQFLGRNDNQVKIRGYRIELGDVENNIVTLEKVIQAVVVAKKQEAQEAHLVAYVIVDGELEIEKIKGHLQQALPDYMIPQIIIQLDALPLTPNQKVDRKALATMGTQGAMSGSLVQANTPMQKRLLGYWKELLQIPGEISIQDNFFALGGHSLNAVKLSNQIKNDIGAAIGLKSIFDYPTIEQLAVHLSTGNFAVTATLPKAPVKPVYLVTPSQYEIWLASQNSQRSIAYNMSAAFAIEGMLNTEKLEIVLNILISKYEVLRTNFSEKEGSVYQMIQSEKGIQATITRKKISQGETNKYIKSFVAQKFDLESDLLIEMKVLELEGENSFLLFRTHHIVLDGRSLEIFVHKLLHYYAEPQSTIVKDNLQFKDYSEWSAVKQKESKNLDFWNSYLINYRIKPSFISNEGKINVSEANNFFVAFSPKESAAIKDFVRAQATTVHNFLSAAFGALVFKQSGHKDICLGTVNAGRNMPELDDMLGMFVKSLPLRMYLQDNKSFTALLKEVGINILQISEHQDIPIEFSLKTPYDTLLVYQNPDFSYQKEMQLPGVKFSNYPIETYHSRLSLLFNFKEEMQGLILEVTYDTSLYNSGTVELIVQRFWKLIEYTITNPKATLGDIDIAMEIEKTEVVNIEFNF